MYEINESSCLHVRDFDFHTLILIGLPLPIWAFLALLKARKEHEVFEMRMCGRGAWIVTFPSFSLPFSRQVTFKGNFFLAFPSFSLPFSRLVTFQPHNETRTLRSFGAHRRDSRHIFCKIFQVFRASTTPENFTECVSRCLHAKMSFCSGLSAFAKGRIYFVVFLRGTTFFPWKLTPSGSARYKSKCFDIPVR